MSASTGSPQPIIPALAPLHRCLSELGYPLIRFAAGAIMIPHGVQKFVNPAMIKGVSGLLLKLGFTPTVPIFWFLAIIELFGGICVAIGFLTRPAALLLAIELLVITFDVNLKNGYFVGTHGFETSLLWALVFLGIAACGGGRLSIDRLIGREF